MLQRFDASQPTASQLMPPPESPEASLPPQQHNEPLSSSQQGHSSSHAAEQRQALDLMDQQSPKGAGSGESAGQELLREGSRSGPKAGIDGLRGISSGVDQPILLSDIKTAKMGHHGTAQASGGQLAPGGAQEACGSGVAAFEADVEVLADSPALASGQPGSPTSSSDLQLESLRGDLSPVWTALSAEVASQRAHPARSVREAVSAAGVGLMPAQRAAAPSDAAALPRDSPVASEAAPADDGSDGEPEEPLWEPEPSPKGPARCAA